MGRRTWCSPGLHNRRSIQFVFMMRGETCAGEVFLRAMAEAVREEERRRAQGRSLALPPQSAKRPRQDPGYLASPAAGVPPPPPATGVGGGGAGLPRSPLTLTAKVRGTSEYPQPSRWMVKVRRWLLLG